MRERVSWEKGNESMGRSQERDRGTKRDGAAAVLPPAK